MSRYGRRPPGCRLRRDLMVNSDCAFKHTARCCRYCEARMIPIKAIPAPVRGPRVQRDADEISSGPDNLPP
jgi:hypothetical protein